MFEAKFEFDLSDEVELIVSGERGIVIGRAEFVVAEQQYLLRYKCADGRAVEAWWTEDALVGIGMHKNS